jgi:hypothetical protein
VHQSSGQNLFPSQPNAAAMVKKISAVGISSSIAKA